MRFGEYLSSKTITLCFLVIAGVLFGVVGIVASMGLQAILLLAAAYVLIIVIWLTIEFQLAKRKHKKLQEIVVNLPEKYLLGEVLPAPSNPVEQQYFRIMKEISRSAVGMVEQSRREKEEYCEYVESWIHEIKTPLTASSLILANGGDVKKLKSELKRADNLTESILYYARMRSAEKDTHIKRFHVAEVYEEAVKSQMELLMAVQICVETDGDFEVYSDPKALSFILKQMLINCAKYCPNCMVKIYAAHGQITVEDNGIGIPSYELHRVTDRGFTGTNGRKLGGSTGMGLYIVQELCERLEIDLQIYSVQNEYTKMTLVFHNLTKL